MTDHPDPFTTAGPGVTITGYSPGSHTVAITAEDLRTLGAAWLATFRSERTREAYGSDLGRFSRWLADHGVSSVLEASRTHVDLYALALEADGYAPSTRARHLSSLSSFYAYLQTEHGWQTNPAARVRRPKLPAYSPRLGLNLDTAPKVIAAAERLGPDHRAVVALCLFAGLRVSEALGVRVEDISTEAGHRVVRVTSKGGRDDVVPLSPAAVRLLADRIGERTSGHVLEGLDRFGVRRLVAALGREAGLEQPLTVHDLRHGAATCALEAGEPIHRVQQLLRHASPVTTQRYDHARDRLDRSSAYALGHALGGAA